MAEDEDGTLAALRAIRRDVLGPLVDRHRGRIVKLMGDGTLIEFPSVVEAVVCAVELQTEIARAGGAILLRAGINLGDVIIEGDDIYGDGVNVAARLEAMAEPGGLCISDIVRDSIGNRVEATFSDLGEQRLKNLDRPVRVWRWAPGGTVPTQPAPAGAAPEDGRLRIVVLPFDGMVADPAHRVLADGLTEDLTTALAKVDALDVVSRTASVAFRRKEASAPEIARALGARYAVEGSVRVAGQRVRINAQLIDGESGGHLWAEKFDGSLADVFELQDSVTQQIVTALEVHLSDGGQVLVWRAEAGDPRAYERFLAGRAAYGEYSREGNARARRCYREALAISPHFPAALAGLARTYIEDAQYRWSPDRAASLGEARRLLSEAFAIAPEHALARVELAHVLIAERWFDEALAECERGVAADPELPDTHQVLATVLVCTGRHDAALRAIQRSLRLVPKAPDFYEIWAAEALFGLGRCSESLAVLDRIVAPKPGWLMAQALRIIVLAALGRHENARAAAASLRARAPRFTVATWRGFLHYPDRPDVPELEALLLAAGLPP